MDIKAWLHKAGEPVAETAFLDEQPLPFVVFLDSVQWGGADRKNNVATHALTVERYSADGEDNALLEGLFAAEAIQYKKEKQWLNDLACFLTTYDFDLIEKK